MVSSGSRNLDPRRYQGATDTPPELLHDILAATDHAYVAATNSPGGRAVNRSYAEVKQSNSCLFVASSISEYLEGLDKGYDAGVLSVHFPVSENDEKGIFHLVSTVRTPAWSNHTVIVDGTWQQFLGHRGTAQKMKGLLTKHRYPDVLIGTSKEIARVALGIGFNESQSQTWTHDHKAPLER